MGTISPPDDMPCNRYTVLVHLYHESWYLSTYFYLDLIVMMGTVNFLFAGDKIESLLSQLAINSFRKFNTLVMYVYRLVAIRGIW
jgi:hypothetical protein